MDLALALRQIWRYKVWLVPVVLLAAFAALSVAYRVSVLPPRVESGSLESGAANLGLVLDSKRSAVAPRDVSVGALAERAVLDAELLRSQQLRESIGRRSGIPWRTISVNGQTGGQTTPEANQPTQVQRAAEIVDEQATTRLYFMVDPNFPIINLYAQAPTAGTAIRLVQGAADALITYTKDTEAHLQVPAGDRLELLQLGKPQGGAIAPGANMTVAAVVALLILTAGCLLILYVPRVAREVRYAGNGAADMRPDRLRRALDDPKSRDAESGLIRRVEPRRGSGTPR